MHERQPRVVNGVPGAGRWASPSHPEAAVPLFDRMDSTYLHPTPFRTAEKCIAFWSTVEIPDAIVDQASDAYLKANDNELDVRMTEEMEAWQQRWFAANPQPAKEKHIPEWEAKFKAEREQYRLAILPRVQEEMAENRPSGLGEYDATQLIRAAQMWYHAPSPSKYPEEDEKVRDHQIELFDGYMTVEEIEVRYGLSRIHDAIRRIYPDDSTDRIVDALSSLGEDNLAIQQEIIRSADQLSF